MCIRDRAFTWQGGEPTLLGLDFYRRAVKLQAKYGAGRKISNSFQTNGVLLDDKWCAFLAENHFLVGLSLDGPAEIHNQYSVTKGGRPTQDVYKRQTKTFATLDVPITITGNTGKDVYKRQVRTPTITHGLPTRWTDCTSRKKLQRCVATV